MTSELSLVRPEQRPCVLRVVLRGPTCSWRQSSWGPTCSRRQCSGAPRAPGVVLLGPRALWEAGVLKHTREAVHRCCCLKLLQCNHLSPSR